MKAILRYCGSLRGAFPYENAFGRSVAGPDVIGGAGGGLHKEITHYFLFWIVAEKCTKLAEK